MPTTSKGFPYPSSSDNPDIPGDFQALAEAIDAEFDSYAQTDANTTYHFEGSTHDEVDDVDLELIGSDGSRDTVHFRAGPGGIVEWDEENQRITFAAGGDLKAIVELTGTSGLLRKTNTQTWELDDTTYSDSTHTHTLDGLSDVIISSATSGQVLKFNGTNWVNGDDATGEAGAAGNAFTTIVPSSGSNVAADSATDTLTFSVNGAGLSITGDADTDTITFAIGADLQAIEAISGTSGFLTKTAENTWGLDTNSYSTTSHNHTLNSLSNVSISSLETGQILKWNGTAWVNSTDEAGGGSSVNSFTSINTPDTVSVQADSSTDTLTIAAGTGVVITGDADTDTVTFSLDSDLAGIASATLTSAGLIRTDGSGVFSVDTTAYITGSSPIIATPTLTLSTSTSVDEGRIAWDSTNDKIIIGDGSTGREFASSTLKTNARTSSYTLVLTDKDKLVEISNASANTLTVPLNSSVPYPIGTQINLLQTGAGQTTVAGASGVTVNATPGLKLRAQWSSATLIKRATDTWVLVGDLSA